MAKEIRFPDLFFRQRLNAVGIPMLCGVSLFVLFPRWAAVFLFLLGIAVLVFAVFARGERRKILLCVLTGLSLSLLVWGISEIEQNKMENTVGEEVLAQGYVISTAEDSFDLALVKLDDHICFRTFRVKTKENPEQGLCIRTILTVTEIYPEKDRSEGIDCLASDEKGRETVGKSLVFSFVSQIRKTLSEAFSREEAGGFLSAILLGDKSKIDSVREDFEKTASQHILAISGLHISQFVGFFVVLLRFLPIGRRTTRILLFPLVGILFLLGGAGISVFRAGFMTLFSLSALLTRRRGDSVTSLIFAASILVLFNPYTIENYSFLFSFLSTFALVTCAVPLSEYYTDLILGDKEKESFFTRVIGSTVSSFTTASAVFVYLLPLQILLIGNVQLFSPLYALILIPLFQFCLIGALIGAIFVFLPFSVPLLWKGILSVQEGFLLLVSALSKASPPLFDLERYAVPVALIFGIFLAALFVRKEKLIHIHTLHFASFLFFAFLYLFLS